MRKMYRVCAGIDVHKKSIVVCLLKVMPGDSVSAAWDFAVPPLVFPGAGGAPDWADLPIEERCPELAGFSECPQVAGYECPIERVDMSPCGGSSELILCKVFVFIGLRFRVE